MNALQKQYHDLVESQGFNKTFPNGFTVSVQWREGCYATRDCMGGPLTCEIAAWDETGEWFKFDDGNDVRGWQTAEQVASFIEMVKSQ